MATAWPAPTRNRERQCGQHQRHPAEAVRTPAAASGSPDSLGRDCNEVDLDHEQHPAPIEGHRPAAGGDSVPEDLFCDHHRRHGSWPPGVEGEVDDHLFQLGLGHAVGHGDVQVSTQLLGAPLVISAAQVIRLRSAGASSG
jgi:hypothetical protein